MTIINRARDLLKAPHSFAYGGEYAAEVVRMHKELSALADELVSYGDQDETQGKERAARAYWHSAAKIRTVLKEAGEQYP